MKRKRLTVSDVRNHLRDTFDFIEAGGEIVVERSGAPVARIIPYREDNDVEDDPESERQQRRARLEDVLTHLHEGMSLTAATQNAGLSMDALLVARDRDREFNAAVREAIEAHGRGRGGRPAGLDGWWHDDLLVLIANGTTLKDAAAEVGVMPATVRRHARLDAEFGKAYRKAQEQGRKVSRRS